jgi:DNA polymerase (family 10)
MARIDNAEVAGVLAELADLMQIDGASFHRVNAFRRAARIVERLPEPASVMIERGTLSDVPGIGKGTLARIEEILSTGTCRDLRVLRESLPPGLREMLGIKGVGPNTVRAIYETLGIGDVDELEAAAGDGRLLGVPRMGKASVAKIVRGVEALRRRRGRVPLGTAMRRAASIVDELRALPGVERIEVAGSIRRRSDTIGDIDVLVASRDPAPILERFVSMVLVDEILSHGELGASVRLHSRQQADLRVLPPAAFGAALHYFTGSQRHNVAMRGRAKRLGLRINEHGVFSADGEILKVKCTREEQVFEAVGLPWIPPELREDAGELEAAERGELPRLIEPEHLRGDLHLHTTASDGRGTAREMAERARELGLDYLAVTDHSKALGFARGLDEARLVAQVHELRSLQDALDFRIAAGTEVDILPDGSLDLDPDLLAQLDWVVASVHMSTEMSEAEMTRRIVGAIESGVVDCIGHPTGRRPGRRDPYPVDLEQVLAAAARVGVAMECNGGPNRMDLSDVACRRARELGVLVVLDTDAHSVAHVGRFEFGLAMARRGWLEPADVLNTRPWDEIAQRRRDRLRRVGISVPAELELGTGSGAPGPVLETPSDDEDAHAWG